MKDLEEIRFLKPADSMDEWDEFVTNSPQGCIFCRSWWLQAVCQRDFEILTLWKSEKIAAGMPLVTSRKLGYTVINMPQLTQTLGPVLSPSNKKTYEGRLSHEMNMLESLIDAMPEFDYFSVKFHTKLMNWLPFYWAGYKQTTLYTYILPDLTDLDQITMNFGHMKRKNIKKAEKMVKVCEDLSPEAFYAHHTMTLKTKGSSISYSYELFKRIFDAAYRNNAGKIWYAIDDAQNIHATIFVVYDHKSAYFLISSIDPAYNDSGATTLLLQYAIAYMSGRTKEFNFEGSMIKNVEYSFRKFGAIQTPYFYVTKVNSPLLKIGADVRAWLRR